jgi:uncharacterized protein (DUF2384 family)
MPDKHDSTYGNLQVTVALVTCVVMLWSDSFEVTGKLFVGLEALAITVHWMLSPARASRRATARAGRTTQQRFVMHEPDLRQRLPTARVDERPAGQEVQLD